MQNKIEKIDGYVFEEYITYSEILDKIHKISTLINNHYKKETFVVVCLLKGSFLIFSELLKYLPHNIEIEFIQISSYEGTSQNDIISIDEKKIDTDGKNILIIEDIIDSGRTIRKYLKKNNPNSIKIFSLLYKQKSKVDIAWYAFKVPDKFYIGFGLDYNQKYRNLLSIYIKKDDHEK